MPHFFFHYHTLTEGAPDDLGASFDTLELAYLDAYRSMVEIGAELLKEQVDPSPHRIEIADLDGRILMELRFDEIFCARRQRAKPLTVQRPLSERLRKSRQLRKEMQAACASARRSVAQAHETLRRAKATT